jgi:predicted HAD superfamily Cof-like phosphohydrolase
MSVFSTTHKGVSILDGGPVMADFFQNTDSNDEVSILELNVTIFNRIRRMMQAFEQDTPEFPGWPSEAVFRLRVRLDLEEFFEKLVLGYYEGDPVNIIDGACDVEVVGAGSTIAFGVNHELCIAEVDRANLSKLGEDGKPVKDEYGKALKGPNYKKPNIRQFLREWADTPAPYDTRKIVAEELFNVLFGEKNYARNESLLRELSMEQRLIDVRFGREPRPLVTFKSPVVVDSADSDSSAVLPPTDER